MNGRRLFREYAQSRGVNAKEFIKIVPGRFGELDELVFKDSEGRTRTIDIDYKEMVHWIIKTKKNPN